MTDKSFIDKSEYEELVNKGSDELRESSEELEKVSSERLSLFGPPIVKVLLLLLALNLVLYVIYSPGADQIKSAELANKKLQEEYPEDFEELMAFDEFFSFRLGVF